MAKQNYNECLKRLLKDEGGYTNDPNDNGGPTNFGITIADYRRYVKPDATATDVKNMKQSEAEAIYRKRYWDAINADNLPSGVDYCVFDYGVNSGITRAKKIYAQKSETVKDPVALINAICDERLTFMKGIRGGKDWQVFGRGWSNRVAGVRKRSIELAKGQPSTGTVAGGATAVSGGIVAAAWAWGVSHWYLFAIAAVLGVAGYLIWDFLKFRKMKNVTEVK